MIRTENCLSDESWAKLKPIGMSCKLLERTVLEGQEVEVVKISLNSVRANKYTTLEFSLPVFDGNVIKWRNSKKALMFVANIQIDSEFDIALGNKPETERMDLDIKTPSEVALRGLEEAITHAIRNWYYGVDPEIDMINLQVHVDQFFSNGEDWRVLKYSDIAAADQQNGIIIRGNHSSPDHVDRLLSKIFNPKYWNLIDLNSTSFSDKANESFRLIKGVSIKEGELVPNDESLPICEVLGKHAIGLDMNPNRAYLIRTTFEQVVDLVKPELPIVTPYSDTETNVLHGLNLLTAVMHLEHFTHEDGIAISESAASRLIASRIITQLVESDGDVLPLVKPGDAVSPDTPVAVDNGHHVLANKLYMPGVVEKMSVTGGKRFGVKTKRCWFKYRSFYPLSTGDKLSNRHGGKGVCVVVPDYHMPFSQSTGEIIDICVGPESIINRRAMAVFWEMMLCNKAQADNLKHIKVRAGFNNVEAHDNANISGSSNIPDYWNFAALSALYSEKTQLSYKGKALSEPTFIGRLFWMRIDKIAREIVSSVGTKRRNSSLGSVIDSAKISGQRCNVAKLLAMSGRGQMGLALDVIDRNMNGKKHFGSLIKAIRNNRFLEQAQK